MKFATLFICVPLLFCWGCSDGFDDSCSADGTCDADAGHPVDYTELYATYDARFKELVAQYGQGLIAYDELGRETLHRVIKITGTPYDFGVFEGRLAKELAYEMLPPEDSGFNQQIIEMYEEVSPTYLERVRGIAAAYGISIEQVDMKYIENEFSKYPPWEIFRATEFPSFEELFSNKECSALSYFGNGLNLANKQMDGGGEFPRFTVSTDYGDGTHRVITTTGHIFVHGMNDGLNDKGLFIGFAANANPEEYWDWGPQEYPDVPAINHTHAARIALERCATVAETIDFFQSIRIYIPDKQRHLLIVDATGAGVVLEWNMNTFEPVVFERQGPYQVMTNTALQAPEALTECWRYAAATERFEQGIVDEEDFFEVVAAIQIPRELGGETIWSTVVDLNELEMRVYPWEWDNQRYYTFGWQD